MARQTRLFWHGRGHVLYFHGVSIVPVARPALRPKTLGWVLGCLLFFFSKGHGTVARLELSPTLDDPTWEEMVAVEPALGRLLADIMAVRDDLTAPSFCAEAYWYRFKVRAIRVVGFQAHRPELRSMEAYETAIARLRAALPECRSCPCLA